MHYNYVGVLPSLRYSTHQRVMRNIYQSINSWLFRRSILWITTLVLAVVLLLYNKQFPLYLQVRRGSSHNLNSILRENLHLHSVCSKPGIENAGIFSNATVYGKQVTAHRHLLFNSVPKSGSRTLVSVMWALSASYNTPEPYYIRYMLDATRTTENKTATLISHLVALKYPTFIHGHVPYLELPTEVTPVYASILREPYSRYVSWYYFMRYGDGDMNETGLLTRLGPDAARPNETLDDCLRLERSDCLNWKYYRLNIMMFCGHDPRCNYDPDYALAKAKKNVDNYLVIGVTEEFTDWVRVLERLMPSMFRGAVEKYLELEDELRHILHTPFKIEPSPEHQETMKKRLRHDIEFYQYVKQRFHKLKKEILSGTGC
ncbi:uronyl 2-sulfotransferase-like [Apostichopus japonicus]|uniref:uronyl 2-sulfotransferase-like n=1 Tax=Stichopus japonicus TaxID=307972 RepID=UPI003AB78770